MLIYVNTDRHITSIVLSTYATCQDDTTRHEIELGLLRYCTQFGPFADVYMGPCFISTVRIKGEETDEVWNWWIDPLRNIET